MADSSLYSYTYATAADPISATQMTFTSQVNGLTYRIPGYDNLSPKAKPAEFPRHELMKDKETAYATELKPHWERAKRLGLRTQVETIEKMSLEMDIKELTKGAGYPLVFDADLEAMFEFPRLRRKLRWYNLKVSIRNIYWAFTETGSKDKIHLRLQKDTVESSKVAIPYGAQLRLEEAKATKIFDSFKVVYPNIVTDTQLAQERARERDPALIGESHGFQFLICSWDLPKDIDQVETDMQALKALKIEG